ncbi:MAG: enterochelin esterase [Myxococcales bacterium]|nr:enterochelin esterase [Myxococcales bacterium]
MPVHNFELPHGRVETFVLSSAALRNNLVGDPSERAVAVYLPEGYDQSNEDYPLMVDLAGFTGSGLKRLAWQSFGESVPQRMDRLCREGRMGPVIGVFPDCFTSLGGNQYINSAAMGLYEDYVLEELVPAVESRYRVRPQCRAVLGKSSGGYGAVIHGLKHGEFWNAIACHSGDMNFDLVYRPDFPATVNTLARYDRNIEQFLGALAKRKKVPGSDFAALMILAMAATYDPDPDQPFGIRLPVDLHTCALDPEAWSRWLAHDPVHIIEDPVAQENLKKLDGVFIDVGVRDQYNIHYGTRLFIEKLKAYGIPHQYEEFDDNHSSIDYRLDASLPFLYQAMTG